MSTANQLYRDRFFFLLRLARGLKDETQIERGIILSAARYGYFEGYTAHMKAAQEDLRIAENMRDYWKELNANTGGIFIAH